MRIVITGATSFVGAAAIQELLENGHEVYAVVRPSSRKLETLTGQEAGKNALREGRLHIVENDLSAPERLTEKIQGSCDAFCHFGWGGPAQLVRQIARKQRGFISRAVFRYPRLRSGYRHDAGWHAGRLDLSPALHHGRTSGRLHTAFLSCPGPRQRLVES